MAWPGSDVDTTQMDAGTDSPASGRASLLDLAQKLNQMRNHVSAFIQALLDDADAATARATLGVPDAFGLRNKIINGGMQVCQRPGSTVLTLGAAPIYGGADRMVSSISGFTAVASATVFQLGPGYGPASGSGYVQNILVSTPTGSGTMVHGQRIEAKNSCALNGSALTVSAMVRQDSGASVSCYIRISKPNAADNFSGTTVIATSAAIPLASSAGGMSAVSFTATLGASDATNGLLVEVFITGVAATCNFWLSQLQLEQGALATPFEHRPVGLEFDLCKRYFQAWRNPSGSAVMVLAVGICVSASQVGYAHLQLSTQMRSVPTIFGSNGISATDGAASTAMIISGVVASDRALSLSYFSGSGLTVGRAGVLLIDIGSANYFSASAEL